MTGISGGYLTRESGGSIGRIWYPVRPASNGRSKTGKVCLGAVSFPPHYVGKHVVFKVMTTDALDSVEPEVVRYKWRILRVLREQLLKEGLQEERADSIIRRLQNLPELDEGEQDG